MKRTRGIRGYFAIASLAVGGCTGVIQPELPIDSVSWTLWANADDALVDKENVGFGNYPNPRRVNSMRVELKNDGRICADDGKENWCGGPLQGIPYLSILNVLRDSYCVRVVDIYGNFVRQGCADGSPPEGFAGARPVDDVSSPRPAGEPTPEETGAPDGDGPAELKGQNGVMVGATLVVAAINRALAKVGLKTRVSMPEAQGLVDFKQGDIVMSEGGCSDVDKYFDDEFSDDHQGTDDYVFGPEAKAECLDQGRCRIGQLVTRAMAEACRSMPPNLTLSQVEAGIIGAGGHGVAVLCAGDVAEISKCVGSPLVLDLAGDGLQLKGPGTASFPLVTSRALDVGWLAGSDDALLVLDLDGDGKITSGRELFGEASGGWASNGFAALARYDDNKDGIISAKDAIFERLQVWRDNGDGISQEVELFSLSAVGVRSIALSYQRSDREDPSGNLLGLVGAATSSSGRSIPVIDVWFRFAPKRKR